MQTIVDFIKQGGLMLIIILAISLLLVVVGVIALFTIRRRRLALQYAIFAFVPLVAGATGTILGRITIFREVTETSSINDMVLRQALEQTWTYLYAGSTGTLLAITLTFLLFKKLRKIDS